MTEPAQTPAPTPATPWYEGKFDTETVGFLQNRGVGLDDPANVAIDMTKAYRELEKFRGVPADQLLRLPKDAGDEAGWKSVYNRLGVPAEAKDYDLSGVKRADGTDIDQALGDTLRAALLKGRVPKEAAAEVAKAIVKHQDDIAAAQAADFTAKLTEEKAKLAKDWGTNAEFNKLTAMQGARRLGLRLDPADNSPESIADKQAMANIEHAIGYARTMEIFRKIGAATSEDTFVESKGGSPPVTHAGAVARMAELQRDQDWVKRFLAGGAAEKREFESLTQQIAAVA